MRTTTNVKAILLLSDPPSEQNGLHCIHCKQLIPKQGSYCCDRAEAEELQARIDGIGRLIAIELAQPQVDSSQHALLHQLGMMAGLNLEPLPAHVIDDLCYA